VLTLIVLTFALSPLSAADVADFSIEWVDSSSFPLNIVYYSTSDAEGNPAGALWVPDRVSVWENGVEHQSGDQIPRIHLLKSKSPR